MNIVCVGEMLVDIIAHPVKAVPFQNDTYPIDEICISTGGDAINTAINLAKLGHDVTYLGRVGNDPLGLMMVQQARERKVNMEYVAYSSTQAQTKSLILVKPDGQRTFLQYAGTSAEFCFEDCNLALLSQADILQIGGTFHLPKFDGHGAAKLLALAQEKGVITSMDVTSDHSGRWNEILWPVYPHLDYFLPSIEQASMIANTEQPEEIADFFLNRGVKNVAIKLGQKGSFFKNSQTAFYAGIYRHIPVMETTGAGDAFCAGFLCGIAQSLPPEKCVNLATACASFAISSIGATAGMGELAEVQAFIENHPPLHIQKI